MNVTIVGCETADASRAAHGEAVSESTEKERVAVHCVYTYVENEMKNGFK